MYDFVYRRPTDVSEASRILAGDPDAKALAGGMTLLPSLKQRLMRVTTLVDLGGIAGLREITATPGVLKIGALTPHDEVARSSIVRAAIPGLATLAGLIGDAQVRNRGTIGGSVANNDPAADYPSAVLALDATIITSKRSIRAADFFLGLFATALDTDELIVGFEFPLPRASAYAKLPNPASRYATVGVFVARFANHCSVGVTGAAGGVFRWTEAEDRLGSYFDPQSVAGMALERDDLNADIHASAEYRAHVAGTMLKRAVASAAAGAI